MKDYAAKGDHSFYNFLSEFRVARNIRKDGAYNTLQALNEWLKEDSDIDVDGFANFLKKKRLTHQKVMTSLSSKILFLNRPENIMPIDNRVKKSVAQKNNLYAEYLP